MFRYWIVCMLWYATLSFAAGVPHIDFVQPPSAAPGSGPLAVTIYGANFGSSSTVQFGGVTLTPTSRTPGKITVTVPAASLATPRTPNITVDGVSNPVAFPIATSSPTTAVASKRFSGNEPIALATADFNGDGIPDIAVANWPGTLDILLGDGLGNFAPRASVPAGGQPTAIALGDFNEDGKTDIVTVAMDKSVSVMTGDGTGGFKASYFLVDSPSLLNLLSVISGDFDADGHLDLVIAGMDNRNNGPFLLRGDGAGHFSTGTTLPGATGGSSMVAGDFNGDGKLDLAICYFYAENAWILLGDGAGNFSVNTLAVGIAKQSVGADDWNGDGKLDLVVTSYSAPPQFYAGDGAGHFSAVSSSATGTGLTLGSGDINNDGKTDVVIQDRFITFTGAVSAAVTSIVGFPAAGAGPMVAADFNLDGRLDFAVTNSDGRFVSVLLQTPPAPFVQGDHKLLLWNRLGSPTEVTHSEVGPAGTLGSGHFGNGLFGGAYVATARDNPSPVTFPGSVLPVARGTVEFWARLSGAPAVRFVVSGLCAHAPCTEYEIGLSDSDGCGGSGLYGRVGTDVDSYCHGIVATESGGYDYREVLGDRDVGEWHHYALVWDEDGIQGIADGPWRAALFLDGAFASRRLLDWAPRHFQADLLPDVNLLLLIIYGTQGEAVFIDNLKVWNSAKTDFSDRFKEGPVDITVTSTPAGLTFTSSGTGCAPGSAYVTPQTLAWTPGSLCTVTFDSPQAGSAGTRYVFDHWEDSSANVARLFTAPESAATYAANFRTQYQLTTAAGAGGTIAPVSGFYDGGNIVILATANEGFSFAGFSGALTGLTNPQTLNLRGPSTVSAAFKANQTITFGPLLSKTFGDPPFKVDATASSSLPVSFAAAGSCKVAGNTVTLTGPGSCTITASQAGNDHYNPAPNVARSFTIKANQTITFGPLLSKTLGDPPFKVDATASSSLPVSFAAAGSCKVAGNAVTLTGPGSCTITASQAGNDHYNPAPNVARSFTISLRVPTDKDQCKNGGWQWLSRADGSVFKNQGDCIQYVNTGK